MSGFCHFTLFYLSVLISYNLVITKNSPDLVSSGGQGSFNAAAKETEEGKKEPSLKFTLGHVAFACTISLS